jgi:hypothetical protein
LEWFLHQPRNATIKGFTNHHWNGITTLQFAKICKGIVANDLELPGTRHVFARDIVTKEEMVRQFSNSFARSDISVTGVDAEPRVDRTLSTIDPASNTLLWKSAGYELPPTVGAMIKELSAFRFRLGGRRPSLADRVSD